ncbi:MAG: signal transduction histidine kinase [Myxococcota bacterium]|jgi:signal transduction histidine kinase
MKVAMPATDHQTQRQRLIQNGRLHWFHWLIVILSLSLTLSAWFLTYTGQADKTRVRFEREVSRSRSILLERLKRYEDALLAGAAFISAQSEPVDFHTWERYADTLHLELKYPGINGIGVIHAVSLAGRDDYLTWQRQLRPDYAIHPPHTQSELMPISYIIPAAGNIKAVGLDVAHEGNRYQAAKQARSTGTPQITGPIVLVQDAEHTPGFLFYAPFYDSHGPPPGEESDRVAHFKGMVYAPFVVHKLVRGTLSPEHRLIRLRLSDDTEILYDELTQPTEPGVRNPLHARYMLEVYGRNWTVEVESTADFHEATQTSQPAFILVMGLLIDALLLWFFVSLSRANQRAVSYADEVASELQGSQKILARTNVELLQFNYRTSHDLIAPLRTIRGFISIARDDITKGEAEEALTWMDRMEVQCDRLIDLIGDLLSIAQAQNADIPSETIDLSAELETIRQGLTTAQQTHEVAIRLDCDLSPPLIAPRRRVLQILENLLSNAIRYASPDRTTRWVEVKARREDGQVVLTVTDNGPGIPADIQAQVFDMFFRGPGASSEGSGLGLYLVKQHVEEMGASITLQSTPEGSLFTLTIPEG